MKFNFYSFITFYFLYCLSEWFIQSNMYFPQYLRHHLSDIFAGPTILYIFTLYPLILIKEQWDLNRNIYLLSPVLSLLLCIFWELKMDKHSDIVDIYCYIGGTALYYLTCINYKTLFK